MLFSGDLIFNGGTPFLLMGSVAGAIGVLENVVRPLSPRTIVPGHGETCGPEVIDSVLGYLPLVTPGDARRGRAAGLSPLEAARGTDLGQYAELGDPERIVGNLHRAYADLDAEATGGGLGTPLSLPGDPRRDGRLQRREAADLPRVRHAGPGVAWRGADFIRPPPIRRRRRSRSPRR